MQKTKGILKKVGFEGGERERRHHWIHVGRGGSGNRGNEGEQAWFLKSIGDLWAVEGGGGGGGGRPKATGRDVAGNEESKRRGSKAVLDLKINSRQQPP